MKIFIALALLAVQANGQGGFFPTLTALTALNASKVGLPVNGAEENTKPYNLPAGYTQKKIVDRRTLLATGTFPTTFSTFDMITFAAPEGATVGAYPNAGQYIFIPPEVGAGGGVGRYNVVDGTFVPLLVGNGSRIRVANPANWTATNGDYTSTDPTTFTPWGTLLVAEETTGGRMFEVQNPFAATTAAANVRWLTSIPGVSHEGIRFDSADNLYFIDENDSGCIYKFVPRTRRDLSVGQTFVLRVNAYNGTASAAYNSATNLAQPRTGPATWIPMTDGNGTRLTVSNPFVYVTASGGRTAGDELRCTPYGRPEDMTISNFTGRDILYFPATSEHAVYSVILTPGDTATVNVFVSRNTTDLATGAAVGTAFGSPDNMAYQTGNGNIYIVEDQEPPVADIWQAVDANGDGVAEHISRWFTQGVTGSEPTGLFFDPNNRNRAIVSVQHPSSGNDAVWSLTVGCDVTHKIYDADTDQPFATIVGGASIASPPCAVNIESDVTCGDVSVPITGVVTTEVRSGRAIRYARGERTPPYFLFGDSDGDVFAGTIAPGTYSIRTLYQGFESPMVNFTMGQCTSGPGVGRV